jgi:hypothetical protein
LPGSNLMKSMILPVVMSKRIESWTLTKFKLI